MQAIADGLTLDTVPSPAAHAHAGDIARRHGAWSRRQVQKILTNPRCTGRQVWGRYRKQEVPVDPADVLLGYTVKMRPNPPGAWTWPARTRTRPSSRPTPSAGHKSAGRPPVPRVPPRDHQQRAACGERARYAPGSAVPAPPPATCPVGECPWPLPAIRCESRLPRKDSPLWPAARRAGPPAGEAGQVQPGERPRQPRAFDRAPLH
jgi:hypothetical protein